MMIPGGSGDQEKSLELRVRAPVFPPNGTNPRASSASCVDSETTVEEADEVSRGQRDVMKGIGLPEAWPATSQTTGTRPEGRRDWWK